MYAWDFSSTDGDIIFPVEISFFYFKDEWQNRLTNDIKFPILSL